MFKQWNHYHLLIMCIILATTATACFRDSGEGVGSQPVSQLIMSDTPFPTQEEEPSATPTELIEEPTETATSTETPTPTITPTDLPVETATMTIDPLFLKQTITATDENIVNVGNNVPGGTAVAQAPTEEPPDDFALTATALIGQLTQDAAEVATTQAFIEGIGTTPTPIATATTDPLLAEPTSVPAQPLVPGADCIHQIRVGETLYKLSLAYGVSVSTMQSASGIANPNLILVGQRVTIPGCGTTGFAPPPTSIPVPTRTPSPPITAQTQTQSQAAVPGSGNSTVVTDSLAAQAQQDLLNNAQADIQANAVIQGTTAQGAAPLVGTRVHIVNQYETLFQIAQTYGTTIDAIAALNGITNINSIIMGDELQIP